MFNKSTAFDFIFGSIAVCIWANHPRITLHKRRKNETEPLTWYQNLPIQHKRRKIWRRMLLFYRTQNMQTVICLRGITRARISTNIIWFCSTPKKWSNPERLILCALLPFKANKQMKHRNAQRFGTPQMLYMHVSSYTERWVWVSISADSCQISIDMRKTNVIWIRDLPNDIPVNTLTHNSVSLYFTVSMRFFSHSQFFFLKKTTLNGRVFYRYV